MSKQTEIEQLLRQILFLTSAEKEKIRTAAAALPAEGLDELVNILERAKGMQAEGFAAEMAKDPMFAKKFSSFIDRTTAILSVRSENTPSQ